MHSKFSSLFGRVGSVEIEFIPHESETSESGRCCGKLSIWNIVQYKYFNPFGSCGRCWGALTPLWLHCKDFNPDGSCGQVNVYWVDIVNDSNPISNVGKVVILR